MAFFEKYLVMRKPTSTNDEFPLIKKIDIYESYLNTGVYERTNWKSLSSVSYYYFFLIMLIINYTLLIISIAIPE